MYCLESKISKQVLLTRKLYCVPSNDDAELIRKLNAVNICKALTSMQRRGLQSTTSLRPITAATVIDAYGHRCVDSTYASRRASFGV